MSEDTLYTIGHSDRELEALTGMLRMAGVELLIDVRTHPSSRRHPWFNEGRLRERLSARDVRYNHLPELGGLREEPEQAGPIGGVEPEWRAYAAHAQSGEFVDGIETLIALAGDHGPAAIMCAERDPERCHRRFVADALVLRGWEVVHLIRPDRARVHDLHPAADAEEGGGVAYPSLQRSLL